MRQHRGLLETYQNAQNDTEMSLTAKIWILAKGKIRYQTFVIIMPQVLLTLWRKGSGRVSCLSVPGWHQKFQGRKIRMKWPLEWQRSVSNNKRLARVGTPKPYLSKVDCTFPMLVLDVNPKEESAVARVILLDIRVTLR